MGDLTNSDSISSVMDIANNVVESNPAEGFLQIIKKKFSENKMYVYIGIAVIVLAVVLYYFYIKNKKETKQKTDSNPVLELPKPKQQQAQPNDLNNQYAQVPQISGDEYWVMDAQGKPVKVSGSFGSQIAPLPVPKQAPSAAEIKMLQQQMLEQQMMQQQMMQQQMEQEQRQLVEQNTKQVKQSKKPQPQQKLKHPEDSDKSESDDIDVELARIKANEDENVAQHDLTNSELAEITKKLEIMGTQLNN
jgi:cell division protein FtsN